MRWFVIFLVVANLLLYLWLRYESLPPTAGEIPPPEVGQLRLMHEPAVEGADSAPPPPEEVPAARDTAGPVITDQPVAPPPPVPVPPPDPATAISAVADGDQAEVPDEQGERPMPAAPAKGPETEPSAATTESPQLRADDEPEATVVEDSPPPAARCARVGPLEPEAADALLAGLPEFLELVSDTTEEAEKADGYYVLVPPLPDRAAGLRMLEKLADAGFSDTWLFRKGAYRNAISLGLFSREDSARRHADNVADKGFQVEVRARTSATEMRWLLLRLHGEGDFLGAFPLPDGSDLREQACPE
jgi:hypothetical protein